MSAPRTVTGKTYRRTWERKRRMRVPEDPAVVAERARWGDLIEQAELRAAEALISAHLRRQLRLQASIVPPDPPIPVVPVTAQERLKP